MTATTIANKPAATSQAKDGGKYLTFRVSEGSYGISVLQIREIIRETTITAVPQLPDYVRGVINLRGRIIPVMDMRLRFGSGEAQSTDTTCIIVVNIHTAMGRETHMGLVVDGVEEVVNLSITDIEEPPNFGSGITTEYIIGMAKIKGAVKTLIKIDRILGATESEQLHQAVFA